MARRASAAFLIWELREVNLAEFLQSTSALTVRSHALMEVNLSAVVFVVGVEIGQKRFSA
jgi:hypothetical protein